MRAYAETVAQERTEAARARWQAVLDADEADKDAHLQAMRMTKTLRALLERTALALSQHLSLDAEAVRTVLAGTVRKVPSDLWEDTLQAVSMRLLEAKAGIQAAFNPGAYAWRVGQAA